MIDEELDVVVGARVVPVKHRLRDKAVERLGITMMVATAIFAIAGLHLVIAAQLVLIGLALYRAGAARAAEVWKLRTERVRVRLDASTLTVGEEKVPLENVALAYVQPHRDGPTVRCENAHGELLFRARVGSEEEAARIIAEIGRQRRRWVATSPLVATSWRIHAYLSTLSLLAWLMWTAAIALAVALPSVAAFPFLVALAVAGVATVWPLAMDSHVVVGADGVAVRWLGRSRFVPWSRVTGVARRDLGVELSVAGEGPLFVVPVPRNMGETREERVAAMLGQIEDAFAAWKSGCVSETAPAVVERLARRDRPVAAWQADLRSMDEDGSAYRATPLRTEELWRIVADIAEREETRAAAAVALRGREAAPERLRVVAEDVASPRLRVLLERAADPETEDVVVAEALGRLYS